ncbi:macro domain-like protein, partial [Trametes versicolor FP-101664 SS1]|uniref:macro domain-like protein n=1 Tax=Trametes versicolor (strain FP-101664) TaxID=717944 RepID=UPI0004623BAF
SPLCAAWRAALSDLSPAVAAQFTVKEVRFNPTALARGFGAFDCVVSPANTFEIMDGGYDLARESAFMVDDDIWALTNTAQDELRARHRGYLPPGSCPLVPLPATLTAANGLRCTSVAVVPTMRTPESVAWHVDLVYECMWILLTALRRWNASARTGRRPGLGTGSGGIGAEKCAKQMCLAALDFARGWGEHPRWDDVLPRATEMAQT